MYHGNKGNRYEGRGEIPQFDPTGEALKTAEESREKRKVVRNNANMGNSYLGFHQYENGSYYDRKALKTAEESREKRKVVRNNANMGNSYLGFHQYQNGSYYDRKALKTAEKYGNKRELTHADMTNVHQTQYHKANVDCPDKFCEITGKLKENGRIRPLIYSHNEIPIHDNIDPLNKAINCYHKGLGDKEALGTAHGKMGNAYGNMGNTYLCLGQKQNGIDRCKKQLEVAQQLGDKRTEKTILEIRGGKNGKYQRGHINNCKKLELSEGRVGIDPEKRLKCLSCISFFITSNGINHFRLAKRFQELPNLKDNMQTLVSSTANAVVMVIELYGVLVVNFNASIVKVTFQALSDGITGSHTACKCKRIFKSVENVLREENVRFNTAMACQMCHGDPMEEELVAELESLTTELCRNKEAMTTQFINGVSDHEPGAFGAGSNRLNGRSNDISSKEQAELRSKCQTINRRISKINKELGTRTSTQALEVTKKSVESDKAIEGFSQDDVNAAVSEEADISQVPGTNSSVQEPIGIATNASEVHYPVEKLLDYFTSSLQQQDWDGLRYEMQSHIPENELCSLQDGNAFFQELFRRNLISDQDMHLLRHAFFQIGRIDCVHYIDLAKESQCLLELENAIQDQAVSGATGEIYNPSVTAVQQNRGITDEADHIPEATGFQITSEVAKNSRENFAGETMQLKEEKRRRENNAVGRNNEGGQQVHETGAQGNGYNSGMPRNYENPSSISHKSFLGPVQEAAAVCLNPLNNISSHKISSQSRKEGPQESFDADKDSDYHLATRRTRASQQVQHCGECSNDGNTPNEPNHAGSRQDEIWMTGSHKTGCCESENVDTGSCVTDNASNTNALSAKNTSQDEGRLKNGNCEAGSIKTGSCNGESNFSASSNSGNFQLKGRRKKKRNGKWSKPLKFSCEHYDRYCDVQFGCCKEFWACHRCHNSNSKCEEKKLRSRDIKKIRCKRCSTVQEFPKEDPSCVECGLVFSDYFCALCQHLTGKQSHPYHCEGCGICRVHEDRSFHCDVCGVCLDVKLLENHICRPDSAHDQCCICFEDAFNGCQILPCSHKIHKDCATEMLKNGITTCPVCRQSFAHKLERRPVNK